MNNAHEIDYEIFGQELQMVEITLDQYETTVAEPGSFIMMEEGIEMKTMFGDGSNEYDGIWGKILSAGKRVLTGEKLFMTAFTNRFEYRQKVTFASPYPGRIVPLDLTRYDGKIICQKDAFLCAAKGVSIGIEFSKRLGRGFFGGEGFIMQKLEGDGLAFMHGGGMIVKKDLALDELLRIDTGCLMGFTQDVDFDITFIRGVKNIFFGGEGLFFATLRGPGSVWIQSLPFSKLADRIIKHAPNYGGSRKGEGSVLGGLGDILLGE